MNDENNENYEVLISKLDEQDTKIQQLEDRLTQVCKMNEALINKRFESQPNNQVEVDKKTLLKNIIKEMI